MRVRSVIIKFSYYCVALLFLTNAFLLESCTSNTRKVNEETEEGARLVKKYCVSCHVSVDPDLLDQDTWKNNVLPAMGKKLGISQWSGQYFQEDLHAGISIVEWQKIVEYFAQNSPRKLPANKSVKPLVGNDFSIERPVVFDTTNVASTTMVKFDPSQGKVYTADIMSQSLYTWDINLKLVAKKAFESPVVDVSFFNDEITKVREELITCIGIINPVDNPKGKVFKTSNGNQNALSTLAETLPRPVKSVTADINKDGLNDIVVCGFGNTVGGLYLFKQIKDKKYSKITLAPRAGATMATIGDYNNDGWFDIMCLFAQEDEGKWMYLNNQKGGFKSVNVLRFPPVYGSSSFQLIDFNKDGFQDILYTSGDNSDFSRILKPYHGIYIFTNNGRNQFKQSFFYPINGCTKAVAADFNQDDKMDIATIAFFADYKNNPQESFMYLMQDQPGQFKAHTLSVEKMGKWLNMDVNDFDNDRYPDIILGNFSIEGFNQEGVKPSWDTKSPFIVLKNQFNKRVN